MFEFQFRLCTALSLGLMLHGNIDAQDRSMKMPKENVIDVPAISDGLCVSNVFQSNMVLQRDKPISIWSGLRPAKKSPSPLETTNKRVKQQVIDHGK